MPATAAYIDELVKDRQEYLKDLHKAIRANRDLRYNRHKINVPEAYKATTTEIRSSIVADMLFRVVATLTTDAPTITVPPFATTETAKRNASLRERWSQAAMEQMARDVSRPVLRMGIDSAVSDALCIWKIVDRKDSWKDFPKRGKGEDGEDEDAKLYLSRTEKFAKGAPFPFTWMDIDPLTYLPVPSSYGVSEVAEVTIRPAVPAMKQFGVFRKGDKGGYGKRRPGQSLSEDDNYAGQKWECIEHWDGNTVSYMLDGELVDQRKVSYGRVPYFVAGGHTTSSRKPDEMYQSVVQPFAHLVPPLDAMLTMMTTWASFVAYPFLVKENPDQGITAGPSDPTAVTEIKPGDVLQNVRFLEAPGTAKALADAIQLLKTMIDRSGLASVMYGQGSSSSSGYMVSQLMTAAQLVYSPIVDNARMALEQMIPFLWQLIERRIKRTVYVWGAGAGKGQEDWLGLGPDDIDGYYACKVALKPLLPMDKFAERQSAIQMVEAGLWGKEKALEETGTQQPEEELDNVAAERAVDSEAVMGPIVQKALERKGLAPKPQPEPAAAPLVDQFGQPLQMPGQQIPGGMPGGSQFMPQLPNLTTPPGMPQQGPMPMPPGGG